MKFIIMDTEFTCWKGSMENNWSENGEYREIIQISAAKIEVTNDYMEIVEYFDELVKPKINPILSDYCKDLTHIKQKDIIQAYDYNDVMNRYKNFITENNKVLKNWSWGNDIDVINENFYLIKKEKINENNFFDLTEIFKKNNIKCNTNSGNLYKLLNIKTDLIINEHNAMSDVLSLFISLKHFKKEINIKELI